VNEFDLLGDAFFHKPSPAVLADDLSAISRPLVGDDKGRFFPTMFGEDHVAKGVFMLGQLDHRFMDFNLGVFSLGALVRGLPHNSSGPSWPSRQEDFCPAT